MRGYYIPTFFILNGVGYCFQSAAWVLALGLDYPPPLLASVEAMAGYTYRLLFCAFNLAAHGSPMAALAQVR